jgi:hypothetical protein
MTYEVLAGDHPFAIRVMSREDTEGSIVSEGVATVTEFVALNAEIVPHTSPGRRRTGRHTLAIDNVGNFPLKVDVRPTDQDALLHFRVRPRTPLTRPGTATMVRVRPKPHRISGTVGCNASRSVSTWCQLSARRWPSKPA